MWRLEGLGLKFCVVDCFICQCLVSVPRPCYRYQMVLVAYYCSSQSHISLEDSPLFNLQAHHWKYSPPEDFSEICFGTLSLKYSTAWHNPRLFSILIQYFLNELYLVLFNGRISWIIFTSPYCSVSLRTFHHCVYSAILHFKSSRFPYRVRRWDY